MYAWIFKVGVSILNGILLSVRVYISFYKQVLGCAGICDAQIYDDTDTQICDTRVSSFAAALLHRTFRSAIPRGRVCTRFISCDFFNNVVKRNRTFTRRKCIIPPTFPPYKDARRGHNGAVPSRTFGTPSFSPKKTSFLLLSIDA